MESSEIIVAVGREDGSVGAAYNLYSLESAQFHALGLEVDNLFAADHENLGTSNSNRTSVCHYYADCVYRKSPLVHPNSGVFGQWQRETVVRLSF